MAQCAHCGTSIVFGGKSQDGFRFCNAKCAKKSGLGEASKAIPADLIESELQRLHQSACPKCGGEGPIDIHVAHQTLSFVVMTRTTRKPDLTCRACARKRQTTALVTTLVGGWWGIPFGLILTPVSIVQNVRAMNGGPAADRPSEELRRLVLARLAQQLAAISARQQLEEDAAGQG